MKISYNWLKSYVSTNLSPEQIAEILTAIGLEVESLEKIESVRGGLKGLVIGEVLSCEKHPDADKLSLTTVDYGCGPTQIVCGAPNVRKGLKVVVATIGTMLYEEGKQEGFEIKKSKIRGCESFGMLCAEDEIGIGSSHAGIIELPSDAAVGTLASEYYSLEEDYLLEIGLTPNRIDAASHYGVARDLAAYLSSNNMQGTLSLPSTSEFKAGAQQGIKVTVEEPVGAPLYAGITISGIKIASSPDWLQGRLRSIGINPKNNVVDITNFILHDLGQPLHAFDADKICGSEIVVRTCPEATIFTTLDDVERKLSASDLMICNTQEPMCLAGVFGGKTSGITDSTTNIFIESAYFNPVWVRKSAKRHGLNTDSSFRFERGTDPNMPLYALERAALLIQELAGGTLSKVECVKNGAVEPFQIELNYNRLFSLIGKNIGKDKVDAILHGLDISVSNKTADSALLSVPPYRVDVTRECDIAEDILRIYGYNNIEIPTMVHSTLSYAPKPNKAKIVETISNFLSTTYTEIMCNSLSTASYYNNLESYPISKAVRIINPLSQELNVMRQTLLFGAMESIQLNSNRRNSDLKLYEIGNCYYFDESKKGQGGLNPYREEQKLSMVISGAASSASWNQPSAPSNFFHLKSTLERLLSRMGLNLNDATFKTHLSDLYSEAVSVSFKGGKELLTMGVVSKKVRGMFDIKADVFYAELSLDSLISLTKNYKLTVSELSKFPEVKRDLALLVDKGVDFSTLRQIALGSDKKLLKNVTLFDVYEGNKLPEGKKSYALSFILEDNSKTLTDNIIDKAMNNLIFQFKKQVGAEVRS